MIAAAASNTVSPRLQRLVSHILVATYDANLLDEVEQRLKAGAKFQNLAPIYSECEDSRMYGGSVGWISRGDAEAAFEEAVFKTPVGKLVRVETSNGLHLLKVEDERERPAIEEITVEELDEILQAEDPSELQLLDVREQAEYDLVNLPQFELKPLSRIYAWEETVDEDLDPDKHTIVMCHHGIRSMRVCQRLAALGFTDLSNVQGGIHAYTMEIDNSLPTY